MSLEEKLHWTLAGIIESAELLEMPLEQLLLTDKVKARLIKVMREHKGESE